MALSNVFQSIRRGAASIGRAVQAATTQPRTEQGPSPVGAPPGSMFQPATPPVPTEGAPGQPQAAPAAPAPRGFSLPSVGDPPDPGSAQYAGEEGKKRYESDLADYKHKLDIHEAYADLDKVFTELHPDRDFEKEYREQIEMQKQQEKDRPQGNPLARFALALSDFNPAVQQSGRSNLGDYDANIKEQQGQSDKSFSQRMLLRQRMHETAAAEAEKKGNWKKALKEREMLALAKADADALEHKRTMEKEGLKQTGATERAKIRRESAENVAKTRASVIGRSHGLSGGFLKAFEKEAAKQVAKLLGPRDIMKDYDQADIDALTEYLEGIAGMLYDQQNNTDDGGAANDRVHPRKRQQPAPPPQKEEF